MLKRQRLKTIQGMTMTHRTSKGTIGAALRGYIRSTCAPIGLAIASLSMAFPGHAWAADATGDSGLTEIVVTAQKYNSTVQNTPISMSAISGDQLIADGITSVEELSREIPGLSMRSAGPGQTEYEARGLGSHGG